MLAVEEFNKWVRDFSDDKETQRELRAIRNKPEEIEDRFSKSLDFGTAGLRGTLGAGLNRMNVYNVRLVTKALAEYIKKCPGGNERGVAIAYDSRIKSAEFALQAALTLCENGIKAYLFRSLRPVPVLSFTIRHLKTIAGIVVTASHNPRVYNGYKVFWEDGGQMTDEPAKAITDIRSRLSFADAVAMPKKEAIEKGLLRYIDSEVDDAYTEYVKKLCVNPELVQEMGNKLKIVYTPLFGSGNVPVRRVLREIGFQHVYTVVEQERPDGMFPGLKVPNPEDPNALKLALKKQEKTKADIAFGTDPDCDRVGIAVKDKSGKVHSLTGNQIGCILLYYILSQKQEKGTLPANGAAVKSIVSTEMARAICEDYGVQMYDVLTGFKYIAAKMQEFSDTGKNTFLFGFEESNGFNSGTEVRDKDGVDASMLIAEVAALCKKNGITMYDLLLSLYEKYGWYGELTISKEFPGLDGNAHRARIMEALRKNPPKEFGGLKVRAVRDYKAGVRTEGSTETKIDPPRSDVLYYELEEKAWIAIRPAGTEPKVKAYVNVCGKNEEDKFRQLNLCIESVNRLMDSIE